MIIAFGSQRGVGKDTCADILRGLLPARYKRTAFAIKAKQILADFFGVTLAFIEEWKNNPLPPPGWLKPVREMLQFFLASAKLWVPTVWIDATLDGEENLIVSDCRHLAECAAVKNRGGLRVMLHRPGYENDDPHPSEAELTPVRQRLIAAGIEGDVSDPDADIFLVNDGTIQDLRQKVLRYVLPRVIL